MWHTDRTTNVTGQTHYSNAIKSTDGSWLLAQPGSPDNLSGYESSKEALWSVSGRSRRTFNACQHYRLDRRLITPYLSGYRSWIDGSLPLDEALGYVTWVPISSSIQWGQGNPGAGTVGHPSVVFGSWAEPFKGLPILFYPGMTEAYKHIPVPASINTYIDRSLAAILPGIRPSLSLPNTLYELKDFKSLPRTIMRAKAVLTSLKKSSGILRALFRSSSDGYLQAQFNILPLLSDVIGVTQALSETRRQLRKLMSNADRRLVRHYSTNMSQEYSNSDESASATVTWQVVPDQFRSRRQVFYSIRQFSATMEYSYHVNNLSGLDNETAALLDVLGVNLNPSIIWNAIPWTFVIDWLVGVSRWLDQFRTRNLEPVTRIHQYCYSIHVKREILTSLGWDTMQDVFRINEDAYRRVVGIPDLSRAFETSGLSSKEFSLAFALGLSRL
jgi:hypothetical protein